MINFKYFTKNLILNPKDLINESFSDLKKDINYKKFNKNNEGDLSKKLSYLVQKNFLYKISIDLKIDNFLKLSHKQNVKMNISFLADSIEALIGGIYLDVGFISAKKFVSNSL